MTSRTNVEQPMKNAVIAVVILCLAAQAAPLAAAAPTSSPDPVEDVRAARALYQSRTWQPPQHQTHDPIAAGVEVETTEVQARARVIGIDYDVESLATKLYLINHARHTVDLAYYIFKRDTIGYAVLGALCDAVRRGVDVRLVVDSIGSLHPAHGEFKALETCADDAGMAHTAAGRPLGLRARVQVVMFNAPFNIRGQLWSIGRRIANLFRSEPKPRISIRLNRRLHDKLLVVDGRYAPGAHVVIGGRNISNHYYGIHDDGSVDPESYRDVELLLRPPEHGVSSGTHVGEISARYFDILFLHLGNKVLKPSALAEDLGLYRRHHRRFDAARRIIESLPGYPAVYADIERRLENRMRRSRVRLAHELANLTNRRAATGAPQNIRDNPNSIMNLMGDINRSAIKTVRLVSPYLFFARYWGAQIGEPEIDEARSLLEWIGKNTERRLEIITNSVITSDNPLAQAFIDMEMAPRLLLPPELRTHWQHSLRGGEFDPALVNSDQWRAAVNHPRILFFQTGRMDSTRVGGDAHYGKLHAKFVTADDAGFVGTTNFDYRSRILNNEAGFFYYDSGELSADLGAEFDRLKSMSYRWGSPEWLKMRRAFMQRGGFHPFMTRWQRVVFSLVHGFYLSWMI